MLRASTTSLVIGIVFAPIFAYAQGFSAEPTINFLEQIFIVLNALIPILVVLTIVYFLYRTFKLLHDPTHGHSELMYSVLLIFVALSVWGLIGFMQNALGITAATQQGISVPTLPDGSSGRVYAPSGSGGDSAPSGYGGVYGTCPSGNC